MADGEPGRRRRIAANAGTTSYLRGWVRTHRRLVATITEVAADGVWRAITERPGDDHQRFATSEHALCALFAAIAAHLDESGDPSAGDMSTGDHRPDQDRIAWLASVTTEAVVDGAFGLIGSGQLDEVATLVRIAALATCPDVEWHPEVRRLATGDAVTRGLGRLDGYSPAIDPVPA